MYTYSEKNGLTARSECMPVIQRMPKATKKYFKPGTRISTGKLKRTDYSKWESDKDDKKDKTYRVRKGQYLDPDKLRAALGAGTGGEAHHIIPGNVARMRSYRLHANDTNNQNIYNQAWNGIILDGTPTTRQVVGSPNVAHRRDGQTHHNLYDVRVLRRLRALAPFTLARAQHVANAIKRQIIAVPAPTGNKPALEDTPPGIG